MIRGVSFQIPQITTNVLWRILNKVDISKYSWYNVSNQSEIWDEHLEYDFFDKNHYSGNDFLKHIKFNHYIIFLKLQAYLDNYEFNDIHTYDEFYKSDCQMLILISDCEFVEIYSKNENEIKAIFKNAISNLYKNIQYITDANDMRTVMDIL